MKIYTFLLLAFFTTLSKAQTHRFVYEYQFKPNSESKEYRKTNMALDINPADVKFYDYENVLNDSINKKGGHNYNWSGVPTLKRMRNSYQNLNYEMMKDYFSYSTTDKMDWKLEKKPKQMDSTPYRRRRPISEAENGQPGFPKRSLFRKGLTNSEACRD